MATSKTGGPSKPKAKASTAHASKTKAAKTAARATRSDLDAGVAAYPGADELEACIERSKRGKRARPFGLLYLIRADREPHDELDTAARRAAGKVTFRARVDRLFIGEGETVWTHVALLEFSHTGALVAAAREASQRLSAQAVSILPFRSAMPPAALQAVLGLARILGVWLDTGDADLAREFPRAEAGRPEVLPSPEQVRTCASDSRETPAYFINFLAYRDRAVYADGGDHGRSGRAAYMRYGMTALLALRAMGARIWRAGLSGPPLTAAAPSAVAGDWDEIVIVRYPTPRTVLKLHRIPGYRSGAPHRDAGLERTALLVASEIH